MLRAMAVLLVMSACVEQGPTQGSEGQPSTATCEIALTDLGASFGVDIWANCDDDSDLEYRLLASGLVTATRLEHPCRSLTHVELLKSSASLADLQVVGWIGGDQRTECSVTPARP